MWLDWYVANIVNVKFVFWCHWSSEQITKRTYEPNITYGQLFERYRNYSVDLNRFGKLYDVDRMYLDCNFHPTDYGYESLKEYLEKDYILQ